jgi:hypothetical protein
MATFSGTSPTGGARSAPPSLTAPTSGAVSSSSKGKAKAGAKAARASAPTGVALMAMRPVAATETPEALCLQAIRNDHQVLVSKLVATIRSISEKLQATPSAKLEKQLWHIKVLLATLCGTLDCLREDKLGEVPDGAEWASPPDASLDRLATYSKAHKTDYNHVLLKSMLLAVVDGRMSEGIGSTWLTTLNRESQHKILMALQGMQDQVLLNLIQEKLGIGFGTQQQSNVTNAFRFLHLCKFLTETFTQSNPNVLLLGPGADSVTGSPASYQTLEVIASLKDPCLTIIEKNPEVLSALNAMRSQSAWYQEIGATVVEASSQSEHPMDQYSIELLGKLQLLSTEQVAAAMQSIITADLAEFTPDHDDFSAAFPTDADNKKYDVIIATKVLSYAWEAIVEKNSRSPNWFILLRALFSSMKPGGYLIVDQVSMQESINEFLPAFKRSDKLDVTCTELLFPEDVLHQPAVAAAVREISGMKISEASSRETLLCYQVQ